MAKQKAKTTKKKIIQISIVATTIVVSLAHDSQHETQNRHDDLLETKASSKSLDTRFTDVLKLMHAVSRQGHHQRSLSSGRLR